MTHSELVQAATDLMFTCADADKWLSRYDLALASETDLQLTEFVKALQRVSGQTQHRLAA